MGEEMSVEIAATIEKLCCLRYNTRAIVFAAPAAYFAGKVAHTFALILYALMFQLIGEEQLLAH